MEKMKILFKRQPLIPILIVLAFISVISILSATPLINLPGASTMWLKQGLFYLASFVIIYIINKVGNEQIYDKIWLAYWIVIALLVGLVIDRIFYVYITVGNDIIPFANTVNGATSWYNLPGFSLQPSEFMKVIIVIILAKVTKEYNEHALIKTFESEVRYIIKCMGVVILPAALIYLQNDAGVVLIILSGVFFVILSSGLRGSWFTFGFLLVGVIIAIGAYLFYQHPDVFSQIISGHTLDRFYGWANPEGTYGKEGYQLFNSLLSYGTAGWLGHGFQSVVKAFPEAHTDFIFAVILTNYGYIGGLITLCATIALDVAILRIGFHTTSNRDKHFIMGIFGMIAFQQIWNIAMILGLLPITGITLPFLSNGGSSLLSYMIAIGMIMDISNQNTILKNKII